MATYFYYEMLRRTMRTAIVSYLLKKDNKQSCQITSFFTNCRTFLILMIQNLSERNLPKSSLIWNVRIFDPNAMISYNRMKFVWRVICIIWYIQSTFQLFCDYEKKRILAIPWMKILKFIKSNLFFYDCIAQHVDGFFFNASIGMKNAQSWHLL